MSNILMKLFYINADLDTATLVGRDFVFTNTAAATPEALVERAGGATFVPGEVGLPDLQDHLTGARDWGLRDQPLHAMVLLQTDREADRDMDISEMADAIARSPRDPAYRPAWVEAAPDMDLV